LESIDHCICGEIVQILPLAQSTVSQHLKVLKAAGRVKGELEGPRACSYLDKDVLEKFKNNRRADLTLLRHGSICEASDDSVLFGSKGPYSILLLLPEGSRQFGGGLSDHWRRCIQLLRRSGAQTRF
jgi:DNA-binding transcriptional ArsR family regulator